jgi:hypothetical protein
MSHYQQIPLPLSTLLLLYEETKARVTNLNRTVTEQHFTQLDAVLDNVVLIDVAKLAPADRSFLKIEPSYPAQGVWVTHVPEKDWEIMWQWKPPLGTAQFTFYGRGLGPKAPSDKPLTAAASTRPDPNSSRRLVRMSYVIQGTHVTPDTWIEWLDRDAKPSQWRDVIRFLGFLGKAEFWTPIVQAIEQGKPCIPLRTV